MNCIPLRVTALTIALCSVLVACQRSEHRGHGRIHRRPAAEPAATPAPAEAAKAPTTDLEQLAQRLVTQSAAVKEGEIVLIYGRRQDAELLENIAVNVRKLGAFPMVDLQQRSDVQAHVLRRAGASTTRRPTRSA